MAPFQMLRHCFCIINYRLLESWISQYNRSFKIEIFFVVTLLLALMGVFFVILPGEQIMVFGDSLGILAAVFYAGFILSIIS